MASYQDIEQRLRSIEERIVWLFKELKQQRLIPGEIVGPDGVPRPRVIQQTFEEMFLEWKNEVLTQLAAKLARNNRTRKSVEITKLPADDQPATESDVPADIPDGPIDEPFESLRNRLRSTGVVE